VSKICEVVQRTLKIAGAALIIMLIPRIDQLELSATFGINLMVGKYVFNAGGASSDAYSSNA
jgi:hypothetical protein